MRRKKSQVENAGRRGAGILMHITSLPSAFGIGDIGPGARAFAGFLAACSQKYWQILPLNPTDKTYSHSPYSASAAMAGNPLLVSPESLVEEGLLSPSDISQARIRNRGVVDYGHVVKSKNALLNKAWTNFRARKNHDAFEAFCQQQEYWLRDFSMYGLLKRLNSARSWPDWSRPMAMRSPETLRQIARKHEDNILEIQWRQFIFHKQWEDLRAYCAELGIQLIGDLPFYVSYDSADTWANRELFRLDRRGKVTAMAGVPPDYFNSDGQLWGMPVFDWHALKRTDYSWWLQRLRRNVELYDIVRLDHFRAFSDYWVVPAGESTAKHGQWNRGPRGAFFDVARRELGMLPFIAEDLGDIDEHVHQLRLKYSLPGMKVLQFAFNGNPAESSYAPHNHEPDFVVYTGTHDNNTTRGWFRRDLDNKHRKLLSEYTGREINQQNVHLELARLAYASVCRMAIIPMQDILGLDESARMNTPASVRNNWLWRMKENQVTVEMVTRMQSWTAIYNRK